MTTDRAPWLFSSPFLFSIGHDPGTFDPDELARRGREVDASLLPELVAQTPGAVSAQRYELADPVRQGERGPTWLTYVEIDDEDGVAHLLQHERPDFGATVRWELLWRRLSSSGEPAGAIDSISMVGMDVAPGTNDAELAEFNDYYTNVHVPEFLGVGHFARGSRYELVQALAHPAPGCPRYLAVYEKFDPAPGDPPPPQRLGDPSLYTPGPDAWNNHVTSWILSYRRCQ